MSSVQQQQQQRPGRPSTMAEEAKKSEGGDLFLNSIRSAAVGPAKAPVANDLESGGGGASLMEGYYDDSSDRLSVFTFLKIVTAFSGLYVCTSPWFFFYDADKGEICPYTVLCATSPVELALLTASRLSAGILYASLTISIMSKCYVTRSYLHHSWLGAVLDLEPSHDVHTYFGYVTLLAGFEHGILHVARFTVANQAWIIYETDTGRSGMVACLLLLPIVLPMKFDFFKKKMSFQFRKNLHMLFLALLVALCFHSVHFRYVGSILLVWYILDRFYFTTKQTFLIDNPFYEAVGRGTMVGLDLPAGYTFKAGSFIYVNVPRISRSEWHPFSIIHVPGETPKAAFYAEAVGDWTQELFRLGLGCSLPLWITTAQPSLLEKSIYYSNLVLVCTGAGITPGVSIIERFAKKKNIHLMWITRDSGMVALFEQQLRKVTSTVHVTGEQTDEVKDALDRLLEPPRGQKMSMGRRKHGLSVLNNDSFFSVGGPGRRVRRSRSDAGGGDEEKRLLTPTFGNTNSNHHHHDVVFADDRPHRAPRPRVRSAVPLLGNRSIKPPAAPVKVFFGRPDIAKYLEEIVAMDSAPTTSSSDGDGSHFRDAEPLDKSQQRSKAVLLKVDSKLKTTQTSEKAKRQKAEAHERGDGSSAASCTNPWLVLYCGAHPKVEEAIATTCDELRVQWKKEYFGTW